MTRSLTRLALGCSLYALAAGTGPACSAPDASATATTHGAQPALPATNPTGGDEMFYKKKDDGLLAVGSRAPEFAVPDQDGKIRKLSDYKGKRVLLWFYPKADTPG
jgi:hypothetical protein